MSKDLTHVPAPCALLDWDSKFFDHRIARVLGDKLWGEQALKIEEWSSGHHVDCLYFLARADDAETIRIAESSGFAMVDIRVTFQINPLISGAKRSEAPIIGEFEDRDLPALQSLARTLYTDTRFFNDPHFSRQKAQHLYSTWITLECQGRAQQVLVARSLTREPVGYISCHLKPDSGQGQIGLVGVSPETSGKGIGRALVLAALDWFAVQGANEVKVVTQANNLSAQRLYQRCGFLTTEVQIWYHKWYSQNPGCKK